MELPTDPTLDSLNSYDPTEYFRLRAKYATFSTLGMGGQSAEAEYKRLFLTCCLLCPHRKGSRFGPSAVWELFTGQVVRDMGIGPDIGLPYDEIFLALSHASPSISWYTQMVGLLDFLLTFDCQSTNPHTLPHDYRYIIMQCSRHHRNPPTITQRRCRPKARR